MASKYGFNIAEPGLAARLGHLARKMCSKWHVSQSGIFNASAPKASMGYREEGGAANWFAARPGPILLAHWLAIGPV